MNSKLLRLVDAGACQNKCKQSESDHSCQVHAIPGLFTDLPATFWQRKDADGAAWVLGLIYSMPYAPWHRGLLGVKCSHVPLSRFEIEWSSSRQGHSCGHLHWGPAAPTELQQPDQCASGCLDDSAGRALESARIGGPTESPTSAEAHGLVAALFSTNEGSSAGARILAPNCCAHGPTLPEKPQRKEAFV